MKTRMPADVRRALRRSGGEVAEELEKLIDDLYDGFEGDPEDTKHADGIWRAAVAEAKATNNGCFSGVIKRDPFDVEA